MRKLKFLIISLMLCVSLTGINMTSLFASGNEPGIKISPNTDYPESDANYQVQFGYQAAEDVTKVELIGGFTFYSTDQNEICMNGEDVTYVLPYEYKEGMYPTGYAVSEANYAPIAMEKNGNLWSVTMPLPGSQYFYGFQLTYADGTSKIVKDPTNMPFANGDSDSGWSLFYVGDSSDCVAGQEYVYPRVDGKSGTVNYVNYVDVEGDSQPLGVYLPKNYDSSKTYKTIYVSHGGGGNEVEWMNIGSANNIMDNLIAEGKVAQAIVVTMDNSKLNFDVEKINKNIINNIIPYIEANYSVSKNKDDRAMCGLSNGGWVTVNEMINAQDSFGYYGVFSPNYRAADIMNNATANQLAALKNAKAYYVCSGALDNGMGRQDRYGTVNTVYNTLLNNGANVKLEWGNGAHDWGFWRTAFTNFVKDYLWDVEVTEPQQPTVPEVVTPPSSNQTTPSTKPVTSVKTGDAMDINGLLIISSLSLLAAILIGNKQRKLH